MKTSKILMMAVFSILTMAVSAQNNTIGNQYGHSTRSKKELMKMEVMKIQSTEQSFKRKFAKKSVATNLSPKEQMKTSVVKLDIGTQYNSVNVNRSGKCAPCLKMAHLSKKEQMKMMVVGLDTCPTNVESSIVEANNCIICNMDVTACN